MRGEPGLELARGFLGLAGGVGQIAELIRDVGGARVAREARAVALELGARVFALVEQAVAEREVVERGGRDLARGRVLEGERECDRGTRVVLGVELHEPEPELDRRAQIAAREE